MKFLQGGVDLIPPSPPDMPFALMKLSTREFFVGQNFVDEKFVIAVIFKSFGRTATILIWLNCEQVGGTQKVDKTFQLVDIEDICYHNKGFLLVSSYRVGTLR